MMGAATMLGFAKFTAAQISKRTERDQTLTTPYARVRCPDCPDRAREGQA
jgi:hypothetical protein